MAAAEASEKNPNGSEPATYFHRAKPWTKGPEQTVRIAGRAIARIFLFALPHISLDPVSPRATKLGRVSQSQPGRKNKTRLGPGISGNYTFGSFFLKKTEKSQIVFGIVARRCGVGVVFLDWYPVRR